MQRNSNHMCFWQKLIIFLKKDNMGQPVLSLIQIYFKMGKWEKNTAFDENREQNGDFV